MDKFVPNLEVLPPLGDLMIELALNADVVDGILQDFVENPPIPEFANLVLAESQVIEEVPIL